MSPTPPLRLQFHTASLLRLSHRLLCLCLLLGEGVSLHLGLGECILLRGGLLLSYSIHLLLARDLSLRLGLLLRLCIIAGARLIHGDQAHLLLLLLFELGFDDGLLLLGLFDLLFDGNLIRSLCSVGFYWCRLLHTDWLWNGRGRRIVH